MAQVKEQKNLKKVEVKTTTKKWEPNPNQKKVLETLTNYPNGALLVDIEIDYGIKVATGVITPLVNKGLIVAEEVDRVSNIVYRDTVIGHKTDHVKRYCLASLIKEENSGKEKEVAD